MQSKTLKNMTKYLSDKDPLGDIVKGMLSLLAAYNNATAPAPFPTTLPSSRKKSLLSERYFVLDQYF